MLLYDLSHTSHSRARTGVQRVALELRKALQALPTEITEYTHDPYRGNWRPLQTWELESLNAAPLAAKKRGAYWPWTAQLRGRISRIRSGGVSADGPPTKATGFFTAEIFTARTGKALPQLFKQLRCPKVALFHDAISLQLPELAPANSVGRFPAYLAELHEFDGIIAVSEDSRQALLSYWNWAGWENHPEVLVSSLGVDHLTGNPPGVNPAPVTGEPSAVPIILCVGSLEGRKNHLTLLNACEELWASGQQFRLRLIGTLQRKTGQSAMDRLTQLKSQGRPIDYDGWISDSALSEAYRDCAFTVYPSLREGFGLPVWESLIHGKPCICSASGATAETATGGGCFPSDTRSIEALAQSIKTLLDQPELRQKLAAEAIRRDPPSWNDAAKRLLEWLSELNSSTYI